MHEAMHQSTKLAQSKTNTSFQSCFPIVLLYIIASLIRIFLSLYGDLLVQPPLKYSDIDYSVYNDAAQYIIKHESPYQRSTYRYTPLIALLCIPNILFYQSCTKLIFCCIDIITAYIIQLLITQYTHNHINQSKYVYCAVLFSLYNPLTITISSRGNCDTLIVWCCITLIYLLTCHTNNIIISDTRYVLSGIVYGVAIHLKIYPIIYLPCIMLYISDTHNRQSTYNKFNTIQYILRTIKQCLVSNTMYKLQFIVSACVTLFGLTYVFYNLYGIEFIYETYLYHMTRIDHRHNFSVWFYTQYLSFVSMDTSHTTNMYIYNIFQLSKSLFTNYITLTQITLIAFSSLYLYSNLSVCMFIITNLFVHNNKVITAQYYIWYIAYIPLFIHIILSNKRHRNYFLVSVLCWGSTELYWLYTGYQLEFMSQNVYSTMHIASLLFYCSNIGLCYVVIKMYQCYTLKEQHLT